MSQFKRELKSDVCGRLVIGSGEITSNANEKGENANGYGHVEFQFLMEHLFYGFFA